MFHKRSEPVSSGLDEFQFVQAGSFFSPASALAYLFGTIQQILANPFCVPIPLNVGGAVVQVNRARAAIQSGPSPIPQLEGKDVWRRADFQNHAVSSRTMDGTGGDEEVIMLASRPLIYVVQRLKRCAVLLRVMQISDHSLSVDARLYSEVHACGRSRIEQVITFILGVGHPKIVEDVLLERS